MFIIIAFWLGRDRLLALFFRAYFIFHTHDSLLTLFVCFFILFHSCCSHAQVFGKTFVHELSISCSLAKWYIIFLAKRDDLLCEESPLNNYNN